MAEERDHELTLRPPEPKPTKKKRGAAKEPTEPKPPLTPEEKLLEKSATVRVEGAFELAYQKRYGHRPIINFGKDRKDLKKLIDAWSEPVVLDLIVQFFRATEPGGHPEIRRMRIHNIADFYTGAQILRRVNGAKPETEMHERTARNIREATKATGRKP